jgi:hypothetical protein
METIAVTRVQAAALLAAAKKRAQRTRVSGGASAYMKRVKGNVPNVTNTGTSCARHLLVRVVCGLRVRAGITHKSRGKVIFKPGTKLARKHPRGVACFMMRQRGNIVPPVLAKSQQAITQHELDLYVLENAAFDRTAAALARRDLAHVGTAEYARRQQALDDALGRERAVMDSSDDAFQKSERHIDAIDQVTRPGGLF